MHDPTGHSFAAHKVTLLECVDFMVRVVQFGAARDDRRVSHNRERRPARGVAETSQDDPLDPARRAGVHQLIVGCSREDAARISLVVQKTRHFAWMASEVQIGAERHTRYE